MAAPRRPTRCPECGGTRLAPVAPDDIDAPLDPGLAAQPFPGALQCRACGALVRWGP